MSGTHKTHNPGLPQGFVKFESLACEILQAYHLFGPMCHTELMEAVEADTRHVSAIVGRLLKNGYIFKQDRALKYETQYSKTEWIFGLQPNTRRHYAQKATVAERQAHYRRKLIAKRSNSIFNLGGTQLGISL